jgi:DNA polymerase III delta subunit
MLSVFFGKDPATVRARAYAHLSSLQKDAALARIDADTYQEGQIADALGSASLFGEETLYLIDSPASHEALAAEVDALREELGASPKQFFIIEGALLAAAKKRYAAHAAHMEEVAGAANERFNTFALAESLARREKKALWIGLFDARRAGITAEEIIGILWWQLKAIRLAALTNTPEEAGMKEYPYGKAKRAAALFPEEEWERLSRELLTLYHDGHAGARDIDLSLEAWTLRI